MNQLTTQRRTQVTVGLVEGNSINGTVKLTGVAKNTVIKLLADIGKACANYMDQAMRNLSCRRVQVDDVWSFRHSNAKNVPVETRGILDFDDIWTWVAIDADSNLVPCWHVGRRDGRSAYELMNDLAARLANRVQLTSDGHRAYLEAVETAFDSEIDYAMLVKIYGKPQAKIRYSPDECLGCEVIKVTGAQDAEHVSTSSIKRQNLTMQMRMRRFTPLTNGFSKKLENHMHAIALHFMYYNFCRTHQSLRCTPAMEAGISTKVWRVEDIVNLL